MFIKFKKTYKEMDILTIVIILIVIVMIVIGYKAKSKRIDEGRSERHESNRADKRGEER
jgi:hypothetical protein